MNPINFQPNIRKLQQQQQQQQILLKYKIKQNEMNRIQNQLRTQQQHQQQQQTPENNAITTINNDKNTVINNDNSQKLAAIKSKIMCDYSNLYRSK